MTMTVVQHEDPAFVTPVTGTSGNVAAGSAVATLPAVAGRTAWVTGFEITGAGATAASVVVAALTNLISGTMSYIVSVPAGVTTGIAPLVVNFERPIPASALNTAPTLTLPSLGAGNTNACVNLRGYYA